MNNVTKLSTSPQALPTSWIEKMFDQMLLDYGKKFTDQWGGADPDKLIRHWSMKMAGYTGEEIKRGLAAMETRDWPPTVPEFQKMCRPPIDETVAYYEAVNGCHARDRGEMGNWSHPAIYWAAVKMAFDLKSQGYSAVKGRWEKELQDEMNKGEWSEIPKPMPALPPPGKSHLSREHAKQMLADLGAAGVLNPGKTDHKLWAKRLLQRHADGEALSMIQLNFAKEALAS